MNKNPAQQPVGEGPQRINPGLFSSATDRWETPQDLFDALNAEFGFTLDACASPENAKVARYYSEGGLEKPWDGVVWCNPPYGRVIGKWTRKARLSAEAGATVVMLLPSRTDTRWWHTDVMQASEIRFLRGRLKFGAATNGAPFPSAVAVFRPAVRSTPTAPATFCEHGVNIRDWADGWPRYYFDYDRAKLEIEAWLDKRGQRLSDEGWSAARDPLADINVQGQKPVQ